MRLLKIFINSNIFLTAIILTIIFINIFFGEKITINNGAGWDGYNYFNFAHNFKLVQFFNGNDIGPYYIHRIFPWLLINITNQIINNHDVQTTFLIAKIFMFLCISLGLSFTIKIAKKIQLNQTQTNCLLLLIFLNASILKFASYYIFLTEYYALTLILASIYFYIEKSTYKLVLTTLFLNFTWPFLLINYYLIYSLITIRTENKIITKLQLLKIHQFILKLKFQIIVRIFVLIISSLFVIIASRHVSNYPINNEDNLLRLDHVIYIIGASINLILFIIYFDQITLLILNFLKNKLKHDITIESKIYKATITTIVLFISIQLISNIFSNSNIAEPGNVVMFLVYRIFRLSSLPFDIILSTMAYIGFLVPLSFLYWKDLKNKIITLNFPAFALTIICMIFLLNGEGRMNIVLWPIISIGLVKYTRISVYKNITFLIIVSLITSRFYWNFNAFGLNQINFFHFPNQGYYMYFSPWLTWKGWLVVACMGIITSTIAYYVKSRNIPTEIIRKSSKH
jgi:hypothetical protein